MTLTKAMSQYSEAYAIAIASAARCEILHSKIDEDSVDLTLASMRDGSVYSHPKLDIQLKATSQDILREHHLAFPLKVKNYNDLKIANIHVPRILVVMIMPLDPNLWLRHEEHRTRMYRCGYWMSLRGEPDTANDTTQTVYVPRINIFNKAALEGMMDRVSQGGLP